ncbi:MAG: hypothetical protein BA861_01875 [Desulfobacterales bacterium S3730MH5]|nr:MAG: hypothetical protein BA861_01875 [Desulfobacterales bacterium S3730MH5]
MFGRAQCPHFAGYFGGHIDKPGCLCGRNPGKVKSPRFNPDIFEEAFEQDKSSPSIIITLQVMTLPRVSPGYPYPVSSVTKGIQDKLGTHKPRTRDTDDADV